ncbi:hypothetical protein HKBW3S42_01875, partial [Candidatus Hakubella thermalkaliphila]
RWRDAAGGAGIDLSKEPPWIMGHTDRTKCNGKKVFLILIGSPSILIPALLKDVAILREVSLRDITPRRIFS